MDHEQCVKEMYQALTLAGVVTMIIFAFVHTMFTSAGECIGFFIGTQVVGTYVVWSVMDWMERKRV